MDSKTFRCTSSVPRKLAKASYFLLAFCSLTLTFDLFMLKICWGSPLPFAIAVLVATICLIVIFIFGKCADDYEIIVGEGVICVFLITYGICKTYILSEASISRNKKNVILHDGMEEDWFFKVKDTDDETGVDVFAFLTVALKGDLCFNTENADINFLQFLESSFLK